MKKTDILLRHEEYEAGKDDNKDIVLLEAKHFTRPITITPLSLFHSLSLALLPSLSLPSLALPSLADGERE